MFEAQYERVKLLGEGSFGSAYLVRRRSNPDDVQVAKEIRLRHLSEQQRKAAFAEAEVLRMMSHSNIVAYAETFLEGPTLHILMEYADGGDLAAKIKDRRTSEQTFREREVMFIFVQLSLALAHVHAKNILHRDLKPLNVFLTQQGVVKLGDFGIARILESASVAAQTVIGTPHYLSPEICNNHPYGMKSDLWSLGVVLYELAALQVPFHATSLPAVVMKICSLTPDALPIGFSAELNNIVFRLLEKEPAKRPHLDAMLRSGFVQQHVQELLSHSLQRNSGGCESLVSSSHVDTAAVAEGKVGSLAPKCEQTRLPKSTVSCQDAAREEFFRNRSAALQAKQRAEAGTNGIVVGASERPGVCPDERERSSSRAVEVRQRAQAEREQRDASRKRELEDAMREARKERMAMQELRLAREVNPVTGSSPPRRSLGNPNAPPDESLESIPHVSEKENVDLHGIQQELAMQAQARKALMERNEEACFSPPSRPHELAPVGKALEDHPSWVIEIPFHDKRDAEALQSVAAFGSELTLKPDYKNATAKLGSNVNIEAGYSSQQPDELTLDVASDAGDLLCGTSRFVPISPNVIESPQFTLASPTDVGHLQSVLASALANPCAPEPPVQPLPIKQVSGNPGNNCELEESRASLEYSMTSTEMSNTLLSFHQEVQGVFEAWPQEVVVHDECASPQLHGSPLPAITEELCVASLSTASGLPTSNASGTESNAESGPLEIRVDATFPSFNPEVVPASPAPEPPRTGSEHQASSPSPAAVSLLQGAPLTLSSPQRVPAVPQPHRKEPQPVPAVSYPSPALVPRPCSSRGPSPEALGTTDMVGSEQELVAGAPGTVETRKKCVCKPSCALM